MNQQYQNLRRALLPLLAQHGLGDWSAKLPPEFLMVVVKAMAQVMREQEKDKETQND